MRVRHLFFATRTFAGLALLSFDRPVPPPLVRRGFFSLEGGVVGCSRILLVLTFMPTLGGISVVRCGLGLPFASSVFLPVHTPASTNLCGQRLASRGGWGHSSRCSFLVDWGVWGLGFSSLRFATHSNCNVFRLSGVYYKLKTHGHDRKGRQQQKNSGRREGPVVHPPAALW